MLEDTVLVGGIAFLALAGLAWLAMDIGFRTKNAFSITNIN